MINVCKETINKTICDFHENLLKDYKLSGIIKTCPYCKKDLPLRSMREISLKLNSRNVGDLAIEFHCPHCNLMNTMYYRNAIKNLDDLLKYLNGDKTMEINGIIEEDMYNLQYNNLIDEYNKSKKEG